MGNFIFGLVISGVGSAVFIGGLQAREGVGVSIVLAGVAISFFGIGVVLSGFKEYLMKEVVDELKKISANTTKPEVPSEK